MEAFVCDGLLQLDIEQLLMARCGQLKSVAPLKLVIFQYFAVCGLSRINGQSLLVCGLHHPNLCTDAGRSSADQRLPFHYGPILSTESGSMTLKAKVCHKPTST